MELRDRNLEQLDGGEFDVFVVGAGINGAVATASLAGRGAKVALVDQGDFGGFTSQESSNLVWGGFKYLENYEIPLVRKLSRSRNRLQKAYPSNIEEIGFLLAIDETAPFQPWLASLGTVGYWGIGNFATHRPRYVTKVKLEELEPVVDTTSVQAGVEYFDAYLKENDARFVFSFIRSALDVGATAVNYLKVTSAEWDGKWTISCTDEETGEVVTCTAKHMVNAAGPFADKLNNEIENKTAHRLVYSKGIHLVVPRLTPNKRVLAFFDETQRLFYIIPMGNRSVIGTTDTRTDSPHSEVTAEDRDFLLRQINRLLNLDTPLTPDDVIGDRSGVRPLVVAAAAGDSTDEDWTALSRKHEIDVTPETNVVTIFGGKLSDCLNVGEEVAEALEGLGLDLEKDTQQWFGEPSKQTREDFYRQARLSGLADLNSPSAGESLADRLWRRYGQRAFEMVEAIQEDPTMGEAVMEFSDLRKVEVQLARRTEMVTHLEDFMRRRTPTSLVNSDEDIANCPALREMATILFGDRAEEKLSEYLYTLAPKTRVS